MKNMSKKEFCDKLEKIYKELEHIFSTGDIKNFTLSEIYSICVNCKELLKLGKSKTISEKIADYFKNYGFNVKKDFHGINYIIEV